jgi:hypothetical protein
MLALIGSGAVADPYARPLGVTPAAEELGHVFFSVCQPTRPVLLEDVIVYAEQSFGWVQADLGTDFGFQTPDGAVTVTLDGNPIEATCEMKISSEVGGDGADLYEDLEAHLALDTDTLPEADYTDGGVVWAWDSYTLTYTEDADGFTISLDAES